MTYLEIQWARVKQCRGGIENWLFGTGRALGYYDDDEEREGNVLE